MKTLAAVALALLSATASYSASSKECKREEAIAAEYVVDYLDSWQHLYRASRDFGHCDDGAIADGFTEAISVLWADKWDRLPDMLQLTQQDQAFATFVSRRIRDESIPNDRYARIVSNATTRCPIQARTFCDSVIAEHKRFMQSNPTVERDARKSGARPSP